MISGWFHELAYSIIFSSLLFGWGINETSMWVQFVTEDYLQFAVILLFPRFAAPVQMYRYYNEQSTRTISVLVALFSESTGFLMVFPMIFTSMMTGNFLIPTPLILIVCILILWFSPIPKPVTPWKEDEEVEEEVDWLENKSISSS